MTDGMHQSDKDVTSSTIILLSRLRRLLPGEDDINGDEILRRAISEIVDQRNTIALMKNVTEGTK